jgi:hypothetical protein
MKDRYSIHVLNAIGTRTEEPIGWIWAESMSAAQRKAGRIMYIGYRIAVGHRG